MEHTIMKLSSYRKTMAAAIAEAQMVSDISGISITALKKEARKFNIQVTRVTPGGPMGAEYEVTFTGREQDLIAYAKEHFGFDDKPGSFTQLKKHLNMSYNDIEEISDKLKMKVKSSRLAQKIAKLKNTFLKKTIPGTGAMFAQKEEVELEEKFALYAIRPFFNRRKGTDAKKGDRVSGPMAYTQAVSKAKQMNVGSSIGGEKRVEIKPMKEEIELDEGRMKDIFTADQEGKSAEEIAKLMKLPLKTVKSILGEETELDEFTLSQLNTLKKSYADMKGKTLSPDKATALSKHLDRIDLTSLKQLAKERIPFLSTLARNKVYRKTGKFEELEEKKLMVKKGDKVREINDFEWRTYSQMGYKLIGKDGDVMKEDRYAGARSLVETIKGLQNKAKKTGMPYSILKKVYDRGMAAWKGGHRPGASQQQWAFARVNSFVTKSSGTWGGADKDLAAKVRGSKK